MNWQAIATLIGVGAAVLIAVASAVYHGGIIAGHDEERAKREVRMEDDIDEMRRDINQIQIDLAGLKPYIARQVQE